jgi:hypothetical protein
MASPSSPITDQNGHPGRRATGFAMRNLESPVFRLERPRAPRGAGRCRPQVHATSRTRSSDKCPSLYRESQATYRLLPATIAARRQAHAGHVEVERLRRRAARLHVVTQLVRPRRGPRVLVISPSRRAAALSLAAGTRPSAQVVSMHHGGGGGSPALMLAASRRSRRVAGCRSRARFVRTAGGRAPARSYPPRVPATVHFRQEGSPSMRRFAADPARP